MDFLFKHRNFVTHLISDFKGSKTERFKGSFFKDINDVSLASCNLNSI